MMKIARIRKSNRETYGLVRDGKIATKDDITDATAVPIPINCLLYTSDAADE